MVRDSMEVALKRILTPKTSLDILRDVEQAKAERRPYVMSFIGVNGVGKVSVNVVRCVAKATNFKTKLSQRI